MISSRLIKSNNAAAGCADIVDNYNPFGGGLALYQLNGNANDVSGNYNGTASNVTYGTGVFGQAGVFNGSTSKVELPNNVSGSGAFSVSTWINTSNITSAKGIFSFGSLTGILTESFIENGLIHFRVNNSTTNFFFAITTSGDISVNTWHNIVYVFPNTNIANGCKIYIDGAQKAAATLSVASVTRDTTRNGFGGRFESGSLTIPFLGSIDQFRIFNTALDPLEVEALYIEEYCICGGTVDTLDILDDSSCIALYPLDGNANDLSGNYSGTPTAVSYGVGEFDLAGVFNGSSSKILSSGWGLNGNTSFTFSMWLNFSGVSGDQHFFGVGSSTALRSYCPVLRNSNELYIDNVGQAFFFPSMITLSTNTWYQFTFVHNSSTNTSECFINNSSVGTISLTVNIEGTIGAIGTRPHYETSYMNGSIDQVRIFNKALSAGEVTTLYDETACTEETRTAGVTQILGDSSCISYLKLDGNATDETGNYTTSVTNVDYGVGEFDQAGYFNNVYSSRVEYNTAILPANIFSVSMWMKVTVLTGNKWILTQYTGGVGGRFVFAYNDNGTLQISNGSSNSGASITEGAIRNNIWQHIVLIKNGSSGWEIYVDNRSIGTWSNTSNIITNQNTVFGGNQNVTTQSIDGQLDNIRVFNKAVSASEVTTLYNEGL